MTTRPKIQAIAGVRCVRTDMPGQGTIEVLTADGPIYLTQMKPALLAFGKAIAEFAEKLEEPKKPS